MQGRMHGTDPVKRGLNGYAYCDNDPVNRVDPDGEIANLAIRMIGGAKGVMISSGFGAVAMFAGNFAARTAGNMLNRAIGGEKQNFRRACGEGHSMR